jgi:hypothetical protein
MLFQVNVVAQKKKETIKVEWKHGYYYFRNHQENEMLKKLIALANNLKWRYQSKYRNI